MSRIFYNSQSQPIQLSHKLGTGGEGSVYEIFGQPDHVAKIYHQAPSPEKADKLIALSKLGNERLLKIAAWPVDVLRFEAGGSLAGFVMKRIGQSAEVHMLHSPKSRLQKFPEASWAFLIYVATNIARAVATTHEHGFIVGDLNPKNILVTHQATVTLLDCDSFQVTTEGKTYACEGGFPEYLPPELQGRSLRDAERTPNHDCFGLAVIIFQLLFMGRHPFSGKFLGAGEIALEDAIRKSQFAFGEDAAARQMQQPPGTLSLAAIPASLNNLFRRAFLSADRPQPHEWIEPLESLAKSLKSCELHSGHHFFNELTACPWCEIEMRARIRLFNFSMNGQNGKRSHFRLDQVWSEVEKLEAESASLALAEVNKEPFLVKTASPEAAEFAHEKRMKLIQAVVLVAVAGFIAGQAASWPLALLLAVLIGLAAKKFAGAEFGAYINSISFVQQRFSAPDNPLVNETQQKFEEANAAVQHLESGWKQVAANNFQPKLEELRNRKETYENLPQIREYQLKQLGSKAHEQQARITAERELDNLRMQLEHELTSGAMFLQRLKQELTAHRQQIVAALPEAYRQQAQAEKDWEAVSKRNPMWPIVIILIVAFLYGAVTSATFDLPWTNRNDEVAAPYSSGTTSSTSDQSTIKEGPPLSPDQTEARRLFERGEEEMKQEKWNAASKLFKHATELDPQFQPAFTQLGHALYRQGEYDQSIDTLLKAIGIKGEFEPNFYLGLAYRAKRQWKLATHSFGRANDLNNIDLNNNVDDPNRADAYYYWGEALMKTGQIKNTIRTLESSEQADAITALGRFQLATFYLWVGKHKQAERQHNILINWDESLARHLQRLMKQHRRE